MVNLENLRGRSHGPNQVAYRITQEQQRNTNDNSAQLYMSQGPGCMGTFLDIPRRGQKLVVRRLMAWSLANLEI